MTHLLVLWFALFAAQVATPATPPPSEFPATQPTQQTTPSTASPDQAASAKPPCPNPDASGNYRVECGVTPPKILSQPKPFYPQIARKQKITGVATVIFIVNVEGKPENVHVTKSIADTVDSKYRAAALTLDQAAIDTVKKDRFTPATLDGRPIAVYQNVSIHFEVRTCLFRMFCRHNIP
jgi:protein TonB